MKNVVGQIASKEDFYPRPQEISRIMRSLDAGGNLQLTAPRRVGKSSILVSLKDSKTVGYHFVYVEVESAKSKNEFFKKLYKEILKSEALTKGKKIFEQLAQAKNNFLRRLKGVNIESIGGFDFKEGEEIDYEEDLINLLSGIELGSDRLVIMIDEFPEVILNICLKNGKDEIVNNEEAISFLQSNRALRNNGDIRGKVQFIYTGSNSLNVTVSNIDASALINDLNSVPVKPLTVDETEDFIVQILGNYNYRIEKEQIKYFITKVEWLIPFYFQLMIQEIINQIEPEETITEEVIDDAFEKIMDQRNDHHFEHYVKRLKRLFKGNALRFVKDFLNRLATEGETTKQEAVNVAHGIIVDEEVKRILKSLTYDGYILLDDEKKSYKFNSPILKMWWYNHEC